MDNSCTLIVTVPKDLESPQNFSVFPVHWEITARVSTLIVITKVPVIVHSKER